MDKTALIIVDLQNDYFNGGKWVLEGIDEAAQNAAELLKNFREKELPIVHVRHEFQTNEAPFFIPGSEGAEIYSSVKDINNEPVILKHHANSFKETILKETLDEMDIKDVLICGAMSHMCIDATTRAASDLGYNCIVIDDACATKAQEFKGVTVPAKEVHAAFMAALAFGYAKVLSLKEIINSIN